jgi:hypothetical protein
MPCCAIAFVFIVKYVIGVRSILELFGIKKKKPENIYGFQTYCELDDFED